MRLNDLKSRLQAFCASCSHNGLNIEFGKAVQNEIPSPAVPQPQSPSTAPALQL